MNKLAKSEKIRIFFDRILIGCLESDLIKLLAISRTLIRNRCIISDPVFQQDWAQNFIF